MLLAENRSKQLDFRNTLYSPMEKLLILDQIRYRKPIKIVKQYFDFYMQLRIQGPIRITPNYPSGWFAEVLSEDKVWTVECNRGELRLVKVGDLAGYIENGGYITAAEEDLSSSVYYRDYRQCCEYRDSDGGSALCVDFCDDGDYDEFLCRCCPWFHQATPNN